MIYIKVRDLPTSGGRVINGELPTGKFATMVRDCNNLKIRKAVAKMNYSKIPPFILT